RAQRVERLGVGRDLRLAECLDVLRHRRFVRPFRERRNEADQADGERRQNHVTTRNLHCLLPLLVVALSSSACYHAAGAASHWRTPMSEPAIVLHGTELSGHAHRVVLLLRMLGLPYRFVATPQEVRRTPEFLKLNPLGQIPVLEDGPL